VEGIGKGEERRSLPIDSLEVDSRHDVSASTPLLHYSITIRKSQYYVIVNELLFYYCYTFIKKTTLVYYIFRRSADSQHQTAAKYQ